MYSGGYSGDAFASHAASSSPAHELARPPPVPLSKRTSSRNALNRAFRDGIESPPSTPPPTRRRTGKGKERPPPPVPRRREQIQQENRAADESTRHSHGLSWSSTTRDSVVDNLLQSLDNLSSQNLSGANHVRDDSFDREKYRMPELPQLPTILPSRPETRPRGHTYSSSLSSGYEGYGTVAAGSPSSKYSHSTKGRRSNSSSNFGMHSSSGGRVQPAKKVGVGRVSSDTQKRVVDDRPGQSQNDAKDSVDYGHTSAGAAKSAYNNRRSMSMDQIDHLYSQSSGRGLVLDRGRPVPSVFSRYDNNFDAAPEPGIPAGPRKKENPKATGPVYVNAAPSKTVRKVNTQSDLRTTNRNGPEIPQHIQDQASDFVRLNSMQSTPSLTNAPQQRTPGPSSGLRSMRSTAPSPHRERPGFFRRVFGSASRTASDSHDSSGQSEKTAPASRSQSSMAQMRQISRENLQPGTSSSPAALSKKPSSFFRRRKKSTSEAAPVPHLPLNNDLNVNVKPALPSPSASSLRKVMDPYLNKDDTAAAIDAAAQGRTTPTAKYGEDLSRQTSPESITEDSDDLDMFHSGYSPPPDASLGRRDPLSRTMSLSTLTKEKQSHEFEESQRMKIKIKKRKPEQFGSQASQSAVESSFLHDASREQSTATIGDTFTPPPEQPRVSPVSDAGLESRVEGDDRPVSRASTGDRIIAAGSLDRREPLPQMRSFSNGADVVHDADDDGWVITHRPSGEPAERPQSKRSERLYLQLNESEEKALESKDTVSPLARPRDLSRSASLGFPSMQNVADHTSQSPAVVSPDPSTDMLPVPSVQVDGQDLPRKSTDTATALPPSSMADATVEYRERARKIYEGDEEDLTKSEAASWLGERTTLSTQTLSAYMQLFDFAGMNILGALRALCGKLLLKGETQQFDRIITALSARWCACNPNHGFKAQDVVHTIFYSLILLNTDLHLADIGEKMSKNAYVKNTLPTIRRVVTDAAPNAFEESTMRPNPNTSRPSLPWTNSVTSIPTSPTTLEASNERTSFDEQRPKDGKRLSLRPSVLRTESDGVTPDSANTSSSNALLNRPWTGPLRAWEFEVETVLKSFYTSIRTEPLPLMGSATSDALTPDRNLSVANLGGGLKRSGSVISKAPSDNMSFRSKPGFRTMAMGWQNRGNRSRPKLYPASTVGSSRTSLDDGNSVWSPPISSKNSFAKTLTSTSVNSLGYHASPTAADFKHSIGFANALSQAIIREEGQSTYTGDTDSTSVPGGLLEDEALTLEGAPWAKEGLVKHKHHLEQQERKAKDRNWNDCFAVISKGKLTLFAFNTSSKGQTSGRKAQHKHAAGKASTVTATKVGGGDWMENAEQLDVFILRQTIASTLPPPGYSKTRPHVWALSLPSGGVHLFQVGTAEIAQEFMTSANYWSARLSKEPLSGGVSNIEYGWSDQVINPALLDRTESFSTPPGSMSNHRHMHSSSGSGGIPRPSFQSSLRGSFDTGFGSMKARTPGDRVHIADWQPPTQSMMASQLLEVDQLRAVTAYVNSVEHELGKHNDLKHGIELAVSVLPPSPPLLTVH